MEEEIDPFKSLEDLDIMSGNKKQIKEEIIEQEAPVPQKMEKVKYSYDSKYPEKLRNEELERQYIGLLLENPKGITKYYILFSEFYFDDPELANIYKSILFTEAAKYTPEVAKANFNFAKITELTQKLKLELKMMVREQNPDFEKVYIEVKKLFLIRKIYLANPLKEKQEQVADICNYDLYGQMSIQEVVSALEQLAVTGKFKQSILSNELTDFLEKNSNNLTSGLKFPFPILNSVFKGLRKGETMAYAMPSNSGKSRFTINLAAFVALVHKQKVLIISNEMSEEKMKLCFITTILNNPIIQGLHGQKIHKTEGEILEFKYRPDDILSVKVDENGFIVKEQNETQEMFVERLKKQSTEFNRVIAATEWVSKEMNNLIYFINIPDHTNEELQKIIINYYYKNKIQYVFYDTLKADIDNIGNGEEIKKTATILSNIAQKFEIFICSTLQLTESFTLPINLTINDLSVSRTVKEVLDTLCLIKQISRDTLSDYQYSLKEVDTKFFELENFEDPDVRYYACVVDKNRAGAKPKVLFRLNLAYNRWEELGYLRLKTSNEKKR